MLTYFRCAEGRIERPDFTPERLSEPPEVLHWLDLEDPLPEEARVLEDVFHFHPLAIEDCLADVHHPKVDDYESHIFVIVHGIRFEAATGQFATTELDLFLGPNYLVTHHRGPMDVVAGVQGQCERHLTTTLPKGVDFLMHQILDALFDDYFPNLDAIEDQIQLVQVEVFEDPTPKTLDRIFALKRDVMRLRRICTPQREIVQRLSRGEFGVIGPKATVYFRDIYDHLYRITEASFAYHDMIQGTLDAYLSIINNRLNETMKRLTIVGAILAPLTVITGVYGMNFDHLPELHWHYGYVWAIGLMAAASGSLVLWFKSKEWI